MWDYAKVEVQSIRDTIKRIDWVSWFIALDSNEMTKVFTTAIFSITSTNIPNKIVKLNSKDAPWVTTEVKTAIRRKHRVYKKFLQRGKRHEDWNKVKEVRDETSKIILDAKDKYYLQLGRKLSNPSNGIKTYWTTLSKLMHRTSNSEFCLF